MVAIEIRVGSIYLLGTYQAGNQILDRLVQVTALKPNDRGWYDEHQEGGWYTIGSVEYIYVDDMTHAERVGGGPAWSSLEYAQDHWSMIFA